MFRTTSRHFHVERWLPQSFKNYFAHSVSELSGLCVLAFVVYAALALWGYHPQDQSFNTSSSLPTLNWMGSAGAFIADFLLQTFGLASFMFLGVAFVWGILLFQSIFKMDPIRLSACLLGCLCFGVFLIGFPILYGRDIMVPMHSNWGKIPCVGGALSYIALLNTTRILSVVHLSFLMKPLLIISLCLSIILAWYSSGLSFKMLWISCKASYHLFNRFIEGVGRFTYQIYIAITNNKPLELPTPNLVPYFASADMAEMHQHAQLSQQNSEEPITLNDEESHITSDHFFEDMLPSHDSLKDARPRTARPVDDFKLPEMALSSDEFQVPTLELLDQIGPKNTKVLLPEQLQSYADQLMTVLEEYGIRGEIVNVRPGPVVTLYELRPAAGIKTSRVIGLADDIARSMSALSARIATVPGQNVIGIELPNPTRLTVYMRELLTTPEFSSNKASLPLILGQDIGGQPVIADLAKMPHLLVAGTTGSGKSVSVNVMILSLLFRFPPDKCKFIMIDPKMLELSIYDGIPHLLAPVVTDPKKAVVALKWAVKEMENRYRAMSKLGVRNIDGFNTRLAEAQKSREILSRRVQTGFDPDTGKPIYENQTVSYTELPYIVVVVDEMADLMLVAGKDIEGAVQRLAQMARAAGIHLVMATQRPSVDVITGTIKANFPTRISFMVTSKIDSRTILGEQGAEQLLGQGDMLYMAGGGRITRVHGPFIQDEEVERIVRYLKAQGEPSYVEGVTDDDEEAAADTSSEAGDKGSDATYRQAVDLIKREGKISTSFIQRHLQIGYNRAARIVDQMEKEGLISAANHVGKREILM